MKVSLLILLLLVLKTVLLQETEIKKNSMKFLDDVNLQKRLTENCWVSAYGRGVGKPYHYCDDPQYPDKSGLLCYPKCRDGFYGVGPVCWQTCPAGYRDDGAYCYKLNPSYGRGVGYVHEDSCVNDNKDLGCEKWGLLWYPKCKSGYHNVGCCVCSADCPSSMTDIGISCQKQSYGRGVGVIMGCAPGEEKQAWLCYDAFCSKNHKGVGPVCWGECPAIWPHVENCMGLCLQNETCIDKVREYVEDIKQLVEDYAANNTAGIIIDIAKIALDSLYDNCDKYTAIDYILNTK